MNWLNELSTTTARLLDYPLGWLLDLPRDASIVLVAVLTSLLLTLARKWTTNQDLLRRCTRDSTRLKTLIRKSKKAGDKPAVVRMRRTESAIKMMRLKADGIVLAASLVPVAMLAVWAVQRLEFLTPRVGEELIVRASFPLSSVDKLTHLVPPPHVEIKSAAIQQVRLDTSGKSGVAEWVLQPQADAENLPLIIRHQDQTVTHVLNVGGRAYAAPVQYHQTDRVPETTVELRQAKFLGLVPGIPAIAFAPWLVAYLILTIPLVPLLRRIMYVN
jgi:hypothetical protein